MTEKDPDSTTLQPFFEAARADTPMPSGDLMARIEADALAMMPEPAGLVSAPQRGIFGQLLDLVGGWPAVSGLAAATAAGVWIGVSPPVSVSDSVASLLGQDIGLVTSGALEPLSGFDSLLVEG